MISQNNLNNLKKIKTEKTITISFKNSLGTNLKDSIQISGEIGESLNIPYQDISGYILLYIDNYQTIFTHESSDINLIYTKQVSAPIVIYHRDSSNNLIKAPEFITGDIGETYHIKPTRSISNYDNKKIIGQFSNEVQEFNLNYADFSFKDIPNYISHYVKIKSDLKPYKSLNKKAKYNYLLPSGTIWKIYKAKEDSTYIKWLNIGGDTWVNSMDDIEIINKNISENPTSNSINNFFKVVQKISLFEKAKVNFSSSEPITVWTSPYGDFKKSKFNDDDELYVYYLEILENGSQWYQLKDGTYIESKYLKLKKS